LRSASVFTLRRPFSQLQITILHTNIMHTKKAISTMDVPEYGFESQDGEEWRDMNEWEDEYAISSHGRILSKPKSVVRSNGRPYTQPARMLSSKPQSHGYIQPTLRRTVDGETEYRRQTLHVLVAEHFLPGPPSDGHCVNHIDGDKTNNCANNLEWVTPAENRCHDALRRMVEQDGEEVTRQKVNRWLDAFGS
jgi:hypothetical protein